MLTRSTNNTPQTAPSTIFTFKFGLVLLLVPLVSVGGWESVLLAVVVIIEVLTAAFWVVESVSTIREVPLVVIGVLFLAPLTLLDALDEMVVKAYDRGIVSVAGVTVCEETVVETGSSWVAARI